MYGLRFYFILIFSVFAFVSYSFNAFGQTKPALMLANRYSESVNLSDYWVSEKLDGVRAYWNGTQFISRQGHVYNAPSWFVESFPAVPMDGELWMGRGTFDVLSGTVRRVTPIDAQWRKVRFMVFDLPTFEGDFDARFAALEGLFRTQQSPYLQLIEQRKFSEHTALMKYLDDVVSAGGEGLMLHLGSAPYRGIRSDDLLKLKKFDDAEGIVVEHVSGQGKYTGMLGALLVQMKNGVRFKIGTGFSDEQRRNPPALGTLITFKYAGKTQNGVPKFASFLRVRETF